MLVYNKHLLFNMHDMNIKVKMENMYFKECILCKQVMKDSNNARCYDFLSLEDLKEMSQYHRNQRFTVIDSFLLSGFGVV
jgi:hypothetical protein